MFYRLLQLLIGIGLFLSLWIVVPAPTFSLLPLGVGAPEISPALMVLNAIALLLTLFYHSRKTAFRIMMVGGLLGLVLSSLPLIQLPRAIQQANGAMQTNLGKDYLAKLSPAQQAQLRPHPFSLLDFIRQIPLGDIRQDLGIPFAQPDGQTLKLNLYRPPQPGLYPGIVVIYGGAWRTGSPNSNSQFSQYLAARGYVVWAISYRHAPHYKFPAQLEDVQTALTFIKDHALDYETDPNRVALLGRSAGGHLATLAAFKNSDLPIRAVVSYYSPVELAKSYYDPPFPDPIDVKSVLRSFIGGDPKQFPEKYRQASPIHAVKPNLPPTLLVYGAQDHLVEVKYGRKMLKKLQSEKNIVVMLDIPWAEHAFDAVFSGVSNQFALYYTERFLAWALL
ncbi:alpha/beta hydrolase [Acaryochloris marina]|uniref:Esterase/lipase/thioesterase, putative n=1 Tax=Acaryochloris marina (strain MBIC 11017) TaxID=329726 RepID=B0C680_ACAM1|nr:alpha/beta hydrolase [Acaryochloris marina]ABW25174.1 esterase/lipase/thioesterase, putative [Acaryochloris marina MBIC11017]